MAIIGSAYVEIRGIDKYLQRDIDNAMKKIKVPSLDFTADVDLTIVRSKIKQLRNELKAAPLQLKLSTNLEEVVDTIDAVKSEQVKDPLVFNVDTNVAELESALDGIKDRYEGISTQVTADADTAAAEAQLAFAARNRRSSISLDIDPKTRKALEGALYTLVGALPADRVKAALQGVAGNFEMLSVAGYGLTTALGAVSAAALTTGANLFSIAADVGQLAGLVALLPAGLFGLITVLKANKMAWEGFGTAAKDNSAKANEALAKLPPEAQEAAKAMRGVREEIQKPVQKAFWEAAGTSLQDMVKVQLPSVIAGMSAIAASMGGFTKEVFNSIAGLGDFNDVFNNVATGISNMVRGINPAIEALATFTGIGSRYLPIFGDYLADLGIRFGEFTRQAAEAGKITQWIDEGINSLQALGTIVSSTVGIFNGLAEAARMSGASGLADMARGLTNIRDIVNGEPFQSRLVSILSDARVGTDAMAAGFRTLTDLIGRSTEAIGEFLETSGNITGQLLENITAMFDGTNLGTGMLTALWSLEDALVVLEPGFKDLGEIMGDLGEISGAVFESMAPGLNNLLSTLKGVVEGVKDGVIAAMPIFNEFFQALLQAASGPIIALATGFGDLLEIFAALPGPLQVIITTLGILVAFRGQITGLFGGISKAFTDMRSGIDGNATGISSSMRNMYSHFRDAGTHISSVGTALRNIPFAVTTSGLGGLATAAGGAATAVGKAAGAGLRGALSGGAAMLGGPWGLALGAGIGLIAAFGQAQADSAERVKAFSGSLDQQTGAITNATKKLVAETALDGATSGWDDFFRGVIQGSASTEEALGTLGISTKEYTDKISDPGGRDAYIQGLNTISNALRDGVPITDEMARAVGTTKEQLAGVNGNTMRHLADEAGTAAGELTKAEAATKAIADATGTSSTQAAILARNYEILASATSSANDKFNALKGNLDIVTNGFQTNANAQKNMAQSLDDTKAKLASIAAEAGGSVQSLYSVADGFNFASQAGRDLHTALEGSADQVLKIGTAAMDQALKSGKSVTDASSAAVQAMQPAIAALRQQLADVGLLPPQIDAIIASFGLMPDQVSTAISIEGSEEAQRKIFLTKLAADSFANGNFVGVISALPDAAKAAIAEATGTAEAFKNGDWATVLSALDRTGPGKEAALAQILSVTNGDYSAVLKALNLTGDPVANATAQALGFKNQDYTAELEAVNFVGPTAADATAVASHFKNQDYTAFLKAINIAGGPAADATAVSNAFKNADYTAFLKALNVTSGPVSDATGAALGFSRADFTAALKAADSTAGGRAAAAGALNATVGASYIASIKAAIDQGTVNSVAGALNGLTAARTATINVQYREVGRNPGLAAAQDGLGAHGGIVHNMTPAGMFGGKFPLAHAFAGGGFENHVAQISRGRTPFRIWSEPETGGEAYIPLSATKRIRSLKILEQVAAMFGYSLFKSFADGGILDAFSKRSSGAPITTTSALVAAPVRGGNASDRPNVSLTINSTDGYTPEQLASSAVAELSWQFLNR